MIKILSDFFSVESVSTLTSYFNDTLATEKTSQYTEDNKCDNVPIRRKLLAMSDGPL